MKVNSELIRVKKMISEDRIAFSEDFSKLMIIDVTKTLGEYLNIKDLPIMETSKTGDNITLKITVNAVGIKNFSSLPK